MIMRQAFRNEGNYISEKSGILFILFGLVFCQNEGSQERNSSDWIFQVLGKPGIRWEVYFSYPGRDVDWMRQNMVRNLVLDLLKNTKEELLLYVYGLTDELILDEIRNARDRGVRIRIVADRDRDYSGLLGRNIPYEIWRGRGLHHPKLILSDRKYVFTGTGNFTTQGLLKDFDGYYFARLWDTKDSEDLIRFLEERASPLLELGNMYFLDSPENGIHIQKMILDSIRSSRQSIDYMIYAHYDPVISEELVRAAQRGVRVRGIYNRPVDPEGIRLSGILPLYGSAVYQEENEDRFDNGSFGLGGLLHHKTMILDNRLLLTGSYNYSRNARDFNREIFQITEDPFLVRENEKEFERVLERSRLVRTDSSESEGSQGSSGNVSLLSEEAEREERSFLVKEWGTGIFRSIGLRRSLYSGFLPISSGIFSLPVSSRRDFPEEFPPFLEEIGRTESFRKVEILTWNSRAKDGVEVRTRPGTDGEWLQAIFLTPSGKMVAVEVEKIRDSLYFLPLSESFANQTAGFLFFRGRSGAWEAMGCYRMGTGSLPVLYRFLLVETLVQSRNLEGSADCSLLGRSGN